MKTSRFAVESSWNQPATHCFHNFAVILTAAAARIQQLYIIGVSCFLTMAITALWV